MIPALLFEPDGYSLDGKQVMGRQAAGNGFLRAAVAARGGETLTAYTATKSSAQAFSSMVTAFDPAARTAWLSPDDVSGMKSLGQLYLPDPRVAEFARKRLPAGTAAWSLTGVTHTTASHAAMDAICDLVTGPVMPWDALVCTSRAVLSTVRTVLEAQRDYLRWRLGASRHVLEPQLPVIPLGVHCADFVTSDEQRQAARAEMGIAPDEVVLLFVGRLSFHAKAHPHSMYTALQSVARCTQRKLVLVQCGWFANDNIEAAFRDGAAIGCPDVRCIFEDGRQDARRRCSWAAADVFISLSDNVQETFGLSPVEAMAAGLPVIVTDWDGYKDTVRDGIDGFRIRTWMPPPGSGRDLSQAYDAGAHTYDLYCGLTCQHIALDQDMLVERLASLVSDPHLRRRLGEAGRERANRLFDWAIVYAQYQVLWRELDYLRKTAGNAASSEAPVLAPGRLDPFHAFAGYATNRVGPGTRVSLKGNVTVAEYLAIARHPLFSYAAKTLPGPETTTRVWAVLGAAPCSIEELSHKANIGMNRAYRVVTAFAKMGLVRLADEGDAPVLNEGRASD